MIAKTDLVNSSRLWQIPFGKKIRTDCYANI